MTYEYFSGREPAEFSSLKPDAQADTQVFDEEIIDNEEYKSLQFRQCTFSTIGGKGVRFVQVTFQNCVFLDCYLNQSDFRNCKFQGCKFIRCSFTMAKFFDCTMSYCRFYDCGLAYEQAKDILAR